MAMRLPTITGQSLFTIEQIELLRRLRNSGLTKDQISNAFENLDRLDRELGPVYNIPITQVANAVTFQQMQAQATQMANQVANQIALSAQVAKAAQAAHATLPAVGQQPVFPHPIAIAPIVTSTTPTSLPQIRSPHAAQNGLGGGGGCSSEQGSPVGLAAAMTHSNNSSSSGLTLATSTPITAASRPPSVSPPALTIADSMPSRKRSPSSDTNDSSINGEMSLQKMVQVNGSVMVPAELTNQRLLPHNNVLLPGELHIPPMTPGQLQHHLGHISPLHHNNNILNTAANNNIAKPEFKFEGIPEISDTNEEYIAFLSKGERACCEEIKEFVQKYNIRQQQIATLSGMCQSYVSRFLRGEFFDMSGRSRLSIIKWYLAYKNCPNKIASAVSAVLMANGHPPAKRFISALDVSSGEFVNTPRRERFVFRPNHVAILEKYFAEDSYPSYEKREEIARTLNASTEASTGKQLEEREIVTAQIISNWFANKRKEMKKIAREGLDVSQVPIRPRGRPSGRFFLSSLIPGADQATDLSLASMTERLAAALPHTGDVTFPTNHIVTSLGINLPGGGANIAPTVVAPIGGSTTDVDMVATDLSLEAGSFVEKDANDNEAATDLSLNSGNTRKSPMDTGGVVSSLGGGARDHDGNMSTPDLAVNFVNDDVELAAVNQAILSLTGQTTMGIKIEKPDPPETAAANSNGVES